MHNQYLYLYILSQFCEKLVFLPTRNNRLLPGYSISDGKNRVRTFMLSSMGRLLFGSKRALARYSVNVAWVRI